MENEKTYYFVHSICSTRVLVSRSTLIAQGASSPTRFSPLPTGDWLTAPRPVAHHRAALAWPLLPLPRTALHQNQNCPAQMDRASL
jgi:hypothetical protein